jgi:hypothetical protein
LILWGINYDENELRIIRFILYYLDGCMRYGLIIEKERESFERIWSREYLVIELNDTNNAFCTFFH